MVYTALAPTICYDEPIKIRERRIIFPPTILTNMHARRRRKVEPDSKHCYCLTQCAIVFFSRWLPWLVAILSSFIGCIILWPKWIIEHHFYQDITNLVRLSMSELYSSSSFISRLLLHCLSLFLWCCFEIVVVVRFINFTFDFNFKKNYFQIISRLSCLYHSQSTNSLESQCVNFYNTHLKLCVSLHTLTSGFFLLFKLFLLLFSFRLIFKSINPHK